MLRDWRTALGNHAFLAFALTMSGMSALESQVYLLFTESARRTSGWDGAAALLPLVGTVANLLLQLRVTALDPAARRRGDMDRPGVLLIGLAFLPGPGGRSRHHHRGTGHRRPARTPWSSARSCSTWV